MQSSRWIQWSCAIVLAASAVGLAGCPASKNGGAVPANAIVVGHYASMTGQQATFGQSTDNGIKLAVAEINAAGGVNGRPIHLITYDDKGLTNEVGSAVTRLITRDKVTAILGEVASSLSKAGAPVCQEHGIPMVSPSSTNPDVTKIGDMIFRVCFIDPFQGYVCAKFAREHQKADKVAILFDQTQAYSQGLADEFEKAFTSMGGKITTRVSYKEGDQDFGPQLTKIRSTEPQMIFVPGYYSEVGNIVDQARKLGIKVPLFGGDGWDSAQLVDRAGDAINGCFYSNHYSHEDPSPRVRQFIEKYQADYNALPDGLAALGYDAANILFDAMKRSGSLSGKDIAAVLASTRDFPGVTGTITIDAERNSVKSAVILRFDDRKPKYVTTIEPTK